jgi:hypothetical protein
LPPAMEAGLIKILMTIEDIVRLAVKKRLMQIERTLIVRQKFYE